MIIKFNPPLGETISFTSPSVLPHRQATPLLFTAQLSTFDYSQIVTDGGHLELWSDIPSEGKYDGTWAESKFLEGERSNEPLSGAYILSLRISPRTSDNEQVQNLYLPITLPPLGENGTQRFSFTYRIVYSSGTTTWLGAFGQNGSLLLITPEPRSLRGIILPDTWSLDFRRQAYVLDIEDGNHSLEVMKLENPADFRIWALGRDRYVCSHYFLLYALVITDFQRRLITDLIDASVVFFVPNIPGYFPALYPSYVLTTSSNANISVSMDGAVNVSGSGNLMLQVNNPLQDPKMLIQKIFHEHNLDGWNILASDTQRQLVAFSSPLSTIHPIRAVIIPLWSSNQLKPLLGMEASNLIKVAAKAGVKEFIVIPRNEEQVHMFNVPATAWEKTRTMQFDFDSAGNDFTITPIYRLHLNKDENLLRSNWGAAILNHHRTVQVHGLLGREDTLPTPPPSTSLTQVLQASASVLNSVEHGENVGNPPQKLVARPEGLNQPKPDLYSHHCVRKEPTSPIPRGGLSWAFICLFASINAIFKFFCGLILVPPMYVIKPFLEGRDAGETSKKTLETSPSINHIDVDSKIKGDSEDLLLDEIAPEENPVDAEDTVPNQTPDTNALAKSRVQSTEWNSEEPDLLASKTVGLVHRNVQLCDSFSSAVSDTESNIFYAEILSPDTKTASVDIVLLPLPAPDATGEDLASNEVAAFTDTSASFLQARFQGAVTFIDEDGPLVCTAAQLPSFFANPCEGPNPRNKHAERSNPINFISYLIRYQLGWQGRNKGKLMISISSPLEPSGLGNTVKAR